VHPRILAPVALVEKTLAEGTERTEVRREEMESYPFTPPSTGKQGQETQMYSDPNK